LGGITIIALVDQYQTADEGRSSPDLGHAALFL